MKKVCTNYITCLEKNVSRWLIILFWLLAAVAGVIWGLGGFLKSTSLTFSAAHGTPSKAASEAYKNAFPTKNAGEVILVYVESINGTELIGNGNDTLGCYVNTTANASASSGLMYDERYSFDQSLSSDPPKGFRAGNLLNMFHDLNASIYGFDYPELIASFTSYCTIADAAVGLAEDLNASQKILATVDAVDNVLGKALISPNRTSTYMLINVKTPEDPMAVTEADMDKMRVATANISAFAKYVNEQLPAIEAKYPNMDIKLTGLPVFGIDVLTGVETQLVTSEGIAFPCALIVLAVMLKSVRLLIIPILCILSSLLFSFFIMWPVALNYNVIQFCPSIMSSVTLALSIDYSLFLLSRFREEVKSATPLTRNEVIIHVMQYAGHTVLVSGCTICLCFLALLFFPIEMLSSVGIGSSITIAVTITCNCTLTPAMLMTFYPFFSDFEGFGFACCCCRKKCLERSRARARAATSAKTKASTIGTSQEGGKVLRGAASSMHETLLPKDEEETDLETAVELRRSDENDIHYNTKSCWYKLGKCTVRLNWLVIVIMVLAVAPFAYFVPQLTLLHEFSLVAPRGSNSSVA